MHARLRKLAGVLGIPDRNHTAAIAEKPGNWEYLESQHDAHRAGRHIDVRLAPDSKAHSWATRRMPEPGEKVLAKQQPTHTRAYMSFQGSIPTGYGAGTVKTLKRTQAEVVEATPTHVAYNVHEGKKTHEYVLQQVGKDAKDWLLINRSTTPGKYFIPHLKPHYKSAPFTEDIKNTEGVLQPKVDGAHSIVLLKGGARPRVFSYRESKRGDVLEYTHKIPGLFAQRVPEGTPRMMLRAETFLADAKGKALSANRTAGILNSGVEKARASQGKDASLRVMPFDIIGDKRPYAERVKLLQELAGKLRGFHPPEAATTPSQKQRMLQAIKSGKHPLTREGVVHWQNDQPVKSKLVDDTDVFLHTVFEGEGKYRGSAGGFTYSLAPGGRPVGKVGGGLSDAQRRTLWKHRDALRNRVAKVQFEKQMPSGALYAPRTAKGTDANFLGWHLDKNLGNS